VKLVGAGGGGGGSAAGSYHSVGGGGAGGGYAEALILVATLGASETVTVGAGTGAVTSAVVGPDGGTSSFGSLVSATGGEGGRVKPNTVFSWYVGGMTGGIGTAGDLLIRGGPGEKGGGYGALGSGGAGGNSLLGGGAQSYGAGASGGSYSGKNADGYGGGGGGAQTNAGGAGRAGGDGGDGIVIVELYA